MSSVPGFGSRQVPVEPPRTTHYRDRAGQLYSRHGAKLNLE